MASDPELTLGFSPCPNDTFIFHALVHERVPFNGYRLDVQLHDVETLNRMAASETLDVSKLSVFAWFKHQSCYRLMESGAALGYGCGPLVVTTPGPKPEPFARWRIALPGQDTTAHLLLRLWAPDAQDRYFVPYDRIFDQLRQGQADAGVIIHENRFTYEKQGFGLVVDLGAWWEQQTGLPIPLGVIAAHKRIAAADRRALELAIRNSIDYARQFPEASHAYMHRHAQEMDAPVLRKHVTTYVNDFSLNLGTKGHAAIARLASMAREKGVLT
jgi:1,4-dihydroxy-6-naphthoate synthase